ncbi:MAG: dual specificity protein phosphatase [Anaeromyxobacteraceae bacterium]
MLDLHFVTPGLAVGAHFPMELAARLAADHGLARVIDVREEACDDAEVLRTHGITLLHLPTCDTRAVSPTALDEAVAFAGAGLDAGERVLVHCQYGIGRSALVAACVLVARGMAPLEALVALKRARPVVSPSPEQLHALAGYAARVHARRRPAWEVPDVEALGRIAWSHLGPGAPDELLRRSSTRG